MFLPPGSKVRFRVQDPQFGAGITWMVKTKEHTGDVYVSESESERWMHSSFHQSGQWHYAVTAAGLALYPESSPPKYLEIQCTRTEVAPGWYHAMRIIVAKSELRATEKKINESIDCVLVPTHPDYDAVYIDIFLGDSDFVLVELDLTFPIAELALGNGGCVAVVARPANLPFQVHEHLASEIEDFKSATRSIGWDGSPGRIVIFAKNDEKYGFQQQIEVAINE